MRRMHGLLMAGLIAVATPAFADEYVMMKVNNQDISSAEVHRMWEGLFPAGQAPAFESAKPDVRERVLRAVMAERLLYAEAIKQGADKSDKLQRELEDVKKKLIVRNLLDTKTADLITEADLKKEYDTMVSGLKDEKEVRASHILLSTEQEAKDAKKQLDGGKKFEEVARNYSKDPGSAKQGGDLGYFTKDKMVKEFADAAFAMKKGEVSNIVKSGFGYHIIKVEDVRKVAPPAFAEVKDQIRGKLQEKKLNEYIANIVKTSDIKIFDAKGKELPFNKNLPEQAPAKPTAAEDKPTTAKVVGEEKADKAKKVN